MDEPELIDKLKKIWEKDIKEEYYNERINSERCLQAVLYHYFRECLGEKCGIFVEPKFDYKSEEIGGLKNKTPDLVITFEENILAIIELKFVPQGYATYMEDFKKFLSEEKYMGEGVWMQIDKTTGKWKQDKVFKITKKTVYIFLAVANTESEALYREDVLKMLTSELKYNLAEKTYLGSGKIEKSETDFKFEKINEKV